MLVLLLEVRVEEADAERVLRVVGFDADQSFRLFAISREAALHVQHLHAAASEAAGAAEVQVRRRQAQTGLRLVDFSVRAADLDCLHLLLTHEHAELIRFRGHDGSHVITHLRTGCPS